MHEQQVHDSFKYKNEKKKKAPCDENDSLCCLATGALLRIWALFYWTRRDVAAYGGKKALNLNSAVSSVAPYGAENTPDEDCSALVHI